MRTIYLTPLRIAALLTLGKRWNKTVTSFWNPSRCIILVLCWAPILVRGRGFGRSISLSFGWLAWPHERQVDIVVRIIVRSAVAVSIGRRPCSCVLRDCRGDYLAGRCGAEHFRNGRWHIDGRKRSRGNKIRSVSYHFGSSWINDSYNK
jgi:hypothetical protein